jgi:hypothetical protein
MLSAIIFIFLFAVLIIVSMFILNEIRIINILQYKYFFWGSVVCIVLCILILLIF